MWGPTIAQPGGLNFFKDKLSTGNIDDDNEMLRAAMKGKKLHVGIVGAGFAGLRCADVLLRHGHKVTIYEARNRVGGRVGQSNHLGHTVDLGPNWIHGTDNNPINEIAKETETQLHGWDESQRIVDVDGTPLSPEEAMKYGQIIWDDGLIASAFKYSRENTADISASKSLMDYFEEKAVEYFTDLPEEEATRKRRTLLDICDFWGSYVGSKTKNQSLKFFWLEECIEGENPFVAGTYTKILEHVARNAIDNAVIRLEEKVTGIKSRGSDGVQRPSITTGRGTEEFDEVVMTAPLGYLKRNKGVFLDGLTPRLEKAIDSIGYGTLDKIYITFPSAFWEKGNDATATDDDAKLDTENTTVNVAATTIPLHQPPSNTTTNNYPGFTHWIKPHYASTTNPAKWDQQAMNLAALPSPSSHPTLLFYIYGDCSTHIASLVTTTPPSLLHDKLVSFLHPYISRLPNHSTSDADCIPKAVLATAWAADEFAGFGSYANFQVGLEDGGGDVEVMREGMWEKGVWIAGEHTAPFVALGTATGAYWSGEKVGMRIVKSVV